MSKQKNNQEKLAAQAGNIPLVKVNTLDAELDSIKRAYEFKLKLNENSKTEHVIKITLNLEGAKIADLLDYARRAIIIKLQNYLRAKAETESELSELVNEYNGKEIKLTELKAKPKVNKDKAQAELKKRVKQLKELGLSEAEILQIITAE